MSEIEIRTKRLRDLYKKIQKCQLCSTAICEKVQRKSEKIHYHSEVFVIAEAMAASQVRLSGVNYFDAEGKIGNTGKMFEKFLNQFGYSVYPDKKCIYHTEIVHCFPGYDNKKRIRRPNRQEIDNCINQGYLEEEIDTIQPKIIILMGKVSYETFYKEFLGYIPELGLSEKIENIGRIEDLELYKGIPVLPIQHASGANPRYSQMLKNKKIVGLVKEILTS